MKKIFLALVIIAFIVLPVFSKDEFSNMKRIWCTMYYKHWAIGYSDSIGFRDVNFYLYLDEKNNKLYNEQKSLITDADIEENEIKYTVDFYSNKKKYKEIYSIDRYTGKATVKGSVRHDYGIWATLTYENRDFEGFGQCARYEEVKKF